MRGSPPRMTKKKLEVKVHVLSPGLIHFNNLAYISDKDLAAQGRQSSKLDRNNSGP